MGVIVAAFEPYVVIIPDSKVEDDKIVCTGSREYAVLAWELEPNEPPRPFTIIGPISGHYATMPNVEDASVLSATTYHSFKDVEAFLRVEGTYGVEGDRPQASQEAEEAAQAAQESDEEPEGTLKTLKELGVPVRAASALEKEGIETLPDLAERTADEVAAIKGVATKSMEALENMLQKHGLNWKGMEQPAPPSEVPEGGDPLAIPSFLRRGGPKDEDAARRAEAEAAANEDDDLF